MQQARIIVKEMLSARGYSEFEDLGSNKIKAYKEGDIIIVFFSDSPKLNISILKNYQKELTNEDINHAIIVYNDVITSSAKRAIEQTEKHDIEIFLTSEFQFNITTHNLVPKHSLVKESEKDEILKKQIKNLPIIIRSDAIVRFYNFKPGDLIRIVRNEDIIAYRRVV